MNHEWMDMDMYMYIVLVCTFKQRKTSGKCARCHPDIHRALEFSMAAINIYVY